MAPTRSTLLQGVQKMSTESTGTKSTLSRLLRLNSNLKTLISLGRALQIILSETLQFYEATFRVCIG